MRNSILYISAILLVCSACVTPKIHNTLVADHESEKLALALAEKKLLSFSGKLEESGGTIIALKTQISDLRNDSIQNGKSLTLLQSKYVQLGDTYDLLASKNSSYIANKAKETKKLLEQLEKTQAELFAKEDELNKLSNSLDVKKQELCNHVLVSENHINILGNEPKLFVSKNLNNLLLNLLFIFILPQLL